VLPVDTKYLIQGDGLLKPSQDTPPGQHPSRALFPKYVGGTSPRTAIVNIALAMQRLTDFIGIAPTGISREPYTHSTLVSNLPALDSLLPTSLMDKLDILNHTSKAKFLPLLTREATNI